MDPRYDLDEDQREELEENLQGLRDLNDPEADKAFRDAGVTQPEFVDDIKSLLENVVRLDNIDYDDEDLSAAQKSQMMGDVIFDIVEMLTKYENIDSEELQEVLQAVIDETDLETYIEDYQSASNDTNVSEYDQDIQELETLYKRTFNMNDLSDEEKLERYDECLDALRKVGASVAGREDVDEVMTNIQMRLGMPDHIFPDHMSEYTALKGAEIKALVDQADEYTQTDARQSLIDEGIEDPSEAQIAERFIEDRHDMYSDAHKMLEGFKTNIFADDDLVKRIDLHAGLTEEYIDRQIEIVENEREQFEFDQQSNEEYMNDPTNMTQEQVNQLGDAAPAVPFKPDGPILG